MLTELYQDSARTVARPRVSLLTLADGAVGGKAYRMLAVSAQYFEPLIRAGERAVPSADANLQRAQRDLVWFVRSPPSGLAGLDPHANRAIAEIHIAQMSVAAQPREIAVAVGALVHSFVDEAHRGAP